jgi:hypothetical protein
LAGANSKRDGRTEADIARLKRRVGVSAGAGRSVIVLPWCREEGREKENYWDPARSRRERGGRVERATAEAQRRNEFQPGESPRQCSSASLRFNNTLFLPWCREEGRENRKLLEPCRSRRERGGQVERATAEAQGRNELQPGESPRQCSSASLRFNNTRSSLVQGTGQGKILKMGGVNIRSLRRPCAFRRRPSRRDFSGPA